MTPHQLIHQIQGLHELRFAMLGGQKESQAGLVPGDLACSFGADRAQWPQNAVDHVGSRLTEDFPNGGLDLATFELSDQGRRVGDGGDEGVWRARCRRLQRRC